MKKLNLLGTKVYEVIVVYEDDHAEKCTMAMTGKQIKKMKKMGLKRFVKKGNTIIIYV